jgi:hypothetical protein
MKERYVTHEQIRRQEYKPVFRQGVFTEQTAKNSYLTAEGKQGYARRERMVFMSEAGMDNPIKTNKLKAGPESEQNGSREALPAQAEAPVSQRDVFKEAVELKRQKFHENLEVVKQEWDNWMKDPKNAQELQNANVDVEKMKALGVTPKEYKENEALFAKKLSKEVIEKLQKEWKDHLGDKEYEKKKQLVTSLIAQGLTPEEFAANYNWEAFFEKEHKQGSGKTLLKTIIKAIFSDVFYDEPDPEKKMARRQAYTRELWNGYNDRQTEKAEKEGKKHLFSVEELRTQNIAIQLGAEPGRLKRDTVQPEGLNKDEISMREAVKPEEVLRNASLKDEERIEAVGKLLKKYIPQEIQFKSFTEEQIAEFKRIHEIGSVYKLTPEEIAKKATALRTWMRDIGISNKDDIRSVTRELIEKGLAGSVNAENETNKPQQPKSPEDMKKEAEAILSGLSEQERTDVKDLLRTLTRKGYQLDLNDPQIVRVAADIIKRTPYPRQITEENIDAEIRNLTAEGGGVDEEGNPVNKSEGRAHLKDADEMREVGKAWDTWQQEQEKKGVKVMNPYVQNQIQFAKEKGLTPNQFPIKEPIQERELKNAWKGYMEIREGQNKPFSPEEEEAMAAAILRGEYPPKIRKEMTNEDLARKYWESFRRSRMKKGKPFSEQEEADMEAAIQRGEPPGISGAAEEGPGPYRDPLTNEPDTKPVSEVKEDENVTIKLTNWEQILRARKNGATLTQIQMFEDELFEKETPDSVEDLAWQIGKSDPEHYGVISDNPVLEVVYKEDGKRDDGTEYKKGERVKLAEDIYNDEIAESRVNKANFVRWIRDRMTTLHGDEPDTEMNFEDAITIDKTFRRFYFSEVRKNPGKYFRRMDIARKKQRLRNEKFTASNEEKERIQEEINSLEPVIMNDLLDEIKRETWAFSVTRTYDLNYRDRSGSEQEFIKMIQSLFAKSPFTKTTFGNKSLMYWVMTMDKEFGTGDHKVGGAINTAYQAYYNLTDTAMLRAILGPDSHLLTKDGLKAARDKAAGIKENESEEKKAEKRIGYFKDEEIDSLFEYSKADYTAVNKALEGSGMPKKTFKEVRKNKNGEAVYAEVDEKNNALINEWAFIKNLNIFSNPQYDKRKEDIVHSAIQMDIAKRYNLTVPNGKEINPDGLSAGYAQLFAYTMSRWTGAQARNNQGAAGYDAWVKLLKTRTYRMKQAEQGYGGAYGNPYTTNMIKGVATTFMEATNTLAKITDEEKKNNPRYENRGKDTLKTPLEVLTEVHAAWNQGGTEEEKAQLMEKAAAQLVFPGNTMKYFSLDHLGRAMGIYTQIIEAEEIKLEKFTRMDSLKGITFERDQFQSTVQEKFIKPMRYLFSTWKQTDFSQMVRVNVGDEAKTVWQEMTLAESMFGRQVLDIPEFWETVKEGTPGAVKIETRDREGEWKPTWRMPHVISGKEINGNRAQLVKAIAKTRIAAELYAHVDLHSNDPRYDFRFYETIFQALESIPGGIMGNEYDLKTAKTKLNQKDRFFSKNDINWIRKASNTTQGRLYGFAILKAILSGVFEGTKEGLKDMSNAVLKDTFGGK